MSNVDLFADRLQEILIRRIEEDQLVLPTHPRVVEAVLELLRRGQVEVADTVSIAEQDPVLSAHIVRRANSSSFNSASGFRSLKDAAQRLGPRTLRDILVQASTRQLVTPRDGAIASAIEDIWTHSTAVALLSRDLAAIAGTVSPEEAYIGGLLHDIGKPVVAVVMMELESGAGARRLTLGPRQWIQVIDRIHRPVGVALSQKWNLTESIARAIKNVDDFDGANRASVWNYVCASNAIAKKVGLGAGEIDPEDVNALLMIGKSVLDLDEDLIGRLATGLHERVRAS